MKNEKSKGFTLIELLVVVAIISVLTTIIIASLTSAKNKAIDKAIIANMLTIRSQAQLYFDGVGSGSYAPAQSFPLSNDCSAGMYSADIIISKTLGQIIKDRGLDYVACFSNTNTFALVARLKFNNDYFCLDSVTAGRFIDTDDAYNGLYGQGLGAAVNTDTGLCN